jgi:hypothetical protein
VKSADAEDAEDLEIATFNKNITKPDWDKNITKPEWPTHNITKPDWDKNITKPTKPQPKPFVSMVAKRLAANETTTTVTVADINGDSFKGIKAATFTSKPNLASISSAAASKWSWATVGFNATVSTTSFTVTLPANYKKSIAWVAVSASWGSMLLSLSCVLERGSRQNIMLPEDWLGCFDMHVGCRCAAASWCLIAQCCRQQPACSPPCPAVNTCDSLLRLLFTAVLLLSLRCP